MNKLLQICAAPLACASALWLAGCAAPQDTSHQAVVATATPSAVPSGPLQPLANGMRTDETLRKVVPMTPPVDIWDRIRRGFAMADLDNDLVHQQEQWYASRPDYLQRMTDRSRKYLFYIVEELERRKMPTELALLPFIESAFNPKAMSSAKAAGMWQFIPSTGKTFDLKQSVFRDDRRDVLASTRAALDYLQKLYGMFGDWQLALAAYNWGEGNVARAVAANQRAGLGTSYAELNMPAETRMYVPKLQAVKNIVMQPDAFNADLAAISNHPYFATVDIKRDIDVAVAARLAQVSVEDFRELNPSANKPVILAAGTPQILLPWDNAGVFQQNLDAYTGPLASWTAWIAPTTMEPADAARRVGMSEAEFRRLNNVPEHMLIKEGSALLAPRSAQKGQDVALHVADHGQVGLAPDVVIRRTVVVLKRKESVKALASRFGLSAEKVAEWNEVGTRSTFKARHEVVLYMPQHVELSYESKYRESRGISPAAERAAIQAKANPPAPKERHHKHHNRAVRVANE